jgi:hypothetical protein
MGHVKALEKTSCKYPVRRVEVKVDTVLTGNMNYVQDNMFLGQLPKRLVILAVNPLLSVVLLSCCPGVSLYHITPVN